MAEKISITVGDIKYILPEGTNPNEAVVFERELREAIRDGGEYTIPKEIEAIYNPGKTPTLDRERVMIMEAEVKEMRKKMEDLNKKIAETEKATPPPAETPPADLPPAETK